MDHSELPGSSKGQSKTQIIVPCKISALKALGIISCEGRGLFNFVLGTFLKKKNSFSYVPGAKYPGGVKMCEN